MQDLTQATESSQEDSPAKTSAWLANVLDYLDKDRVYFGKLEESLMKPKRNTSSSKMFPVYCHQTTDKIWQPSSVRWLSSGMASRGECLMLSSLEYPNAVVESSLSDVLETTGNHLHKYLISRKAAEGILRRANKRGKTLPEPLQKVLEKLVDEGDDVVHEKSQGAEQG